jgi:hypothetical protein
MHVVVLVPNRIKTVFTETSSATMNFLRKFLRVFDKYKEAGAAICNLAPTPGLRRKFNFSS